VPLDPREQPIEALAVAHEGVVDVGDEHALDVQQSSAAVGHGGRLAPVLSAAVNDSANPVDEDLRVRVPRVAAADRAHSILLPRRPPRPVGEGVANRSPEALGIGRVHDQAVPAVLDDLPGASVARRDDR
jgi:hypothetical protein